MPQIQVLPAVPTFGNKLASVLGEAGGNVAESYIKKRQSEQRDTKVKTLTSQLQEPGKSSMEKVGIVTQISKLLPPEQAKALLPLFAPLIYQKAPAQGAQQGQQPGAATNYGVPEGATQPITAATQPTGVENAPSPGGQTLSDIRARKEELMPLVGLPYGIGERAKIELQDLQQQEKLLAKEGIDIRAAYRDEERKYAEKENLPFFEKISTDRETLPAAIQSNDQVIDAILNGNVGPGSLANIGRIASDLGIPSSITKMLESTDSKEFNNGIKGLMGHTIKDTFRGTTTQREIEIAEAMQAEIGVKPQANLAAAWAVQSDLLLRQERVRLYDSLIEQGVSRAKIPAIVDKQLQPYRKQLKDQYFEAIATLRKK